MPARGPTAFYVQVTPSGSILLRGELDLATVQDLQDKIDEIMVPGRPVVLDLEQLTFLDSSAMTCFLKTWQGSGHPVVLHNTSPSVRRILEWGKLDGEAWVYDGESPSSATE